MENCATVTKDDLFRSYCDGLEKVSGLDKNTFKVPSELIEKRQETWNNLFMKYSNNMPEAEELCMKTLKPIENAEDEYTPVQRLPMRKSLEYIQYWVDTGNLIFNQHSTSNNVRSESGSSISEHEFSSYVDSDILFASSDYLDYIKDLKKAVEKNEHKTDESLFSSSVDTAVYIKQNNNITKRAETQAIVKDSKISDNMVATKENLRACVTNEVKDVNKNNKDFEFIHPAMQFRNSNNQKSNQDTDCSKLTHGKNILKSSSDTSDESLVNGKSTLNEITQSSKLSLRRKLYIRTDSPVDLNATRNRTSNQKNRFSRLHNKEHPALETSSVHSVHSVFRSPVSIPQCSINKDVNSGLKQFKKLDDVITEIAQRHVLTSPNGNVEVSNQGKRGLTSSKDVDLPMNNCQSVLTETNNSAKGVISHNKISGYRIEPIVNHSKLPRKMSCIRNADVSVNQLHTSSDEDYSSKHRKLNSSELSHRRTGKELHSLLDTSFTDISQASTIKLCSGSSNKENKNNYDIDELNITGSISSRETVCKYSEPAKNIIKQETSQSTGINVGSEQNMEICNTISEKLQDFDSISRQKMDKLLLNDKLTIDNANLNISDMTKQVNVLNLSLNQSLTDISQATTIINCNKDNEIILNRDYKNICDFDELHSIASMSTIKMPTKNLNFHKNMHNQKTLKTVKTSVIKENICDFDELHSIASMSTIKMPTKNLNFHKNMHNQETLKTVKTSIIKENICDFDERNSIASMSTIKMRAKNLNFHKNIQNQETLYESLFHEVNETTRQEMDTFNDNQHIIVNNASDMNKVDTFENLTDTNYNSFMPVLSSDESEIFWNSSKPKSNKKRMSPTNRRHKKKYRKTVTGDKICRRGKYKLERNYTINCHSTKIASLTIGSSSSSLLSDEKPEVCEKPVDKNSSSNSVQASHNVQIFDLQDDTSGNESSNKSSSHHVPLIPNSLLANEKYELESLDQKSKTENLKVGFKGNEQSFTGEKNERKYEDPKVLKTNMQNSVGSKISEKITEEIPTNDINSKVILTKERMSINSSESMEINQEKRLTRRQKIMKKSPPQIHNVQKTFGIISQKQKKLYKNYFILSSDDESLESSDEFEEKTDSIQHSDSGLENGDHRTRKNTSDISLLDFGCDSSDSDGMSLSIYERK